MTRRRWPRCRQGARNRIGGKEPSDAAGAGFTDRFVEGGLCSRGTHRRFPVLDATRALRFGPAMTRPVLSVCALAIVLTTGCSATKFASTWENPNYEGGAFKKLMIIALGVSPGGRAEFENTVADALVAQGVLGVGSDGYFSAADQMTREAVRTWVKRDGYQGVLVARLVDVQRTQYVQPPQYTDLCGYWGYYGTAMTPGYVVDQTTLLINTDLFDASTGQVVYTAESKSFDPSSRQQVIRELTSLLVKDLTKRGLLPPRQ